MVLLEQLFPAGEPSPLVVPWEAGPSAVQAISVEKAWASSAVAPWEVEAVLAAPLSPSVLQALPSIALEPRPLGR